jgi:glutaredoxin/glutathione-dependent peroxiredoxin
MTIKVGDRIPSVTLTTMQDGKPTPVKSDEFFGGKKVALFSVPGAFTPTCSAKHLPSFLDNEDKLKAKGVDAIACTAVNDAFVMNAWSGQAGADGRVTMLADGNGELARALGLELDATKFGMGMRGKRWSMLIDNGVVKQLNIEEPGAFGVSSGDHMAGQL